ncbi:MAG: polyisoprenoid-binding protein [Calditrichales bacterium]|nr:MAG: polyisoprenoid-binding protein [Calditrichales bacterium]
MKRLNAKHVVNALLFSFIFSGIGFAGDATNWNVDKSHSSVNFKIWHLMTPVYGKFDDYNIDLNFDPENLAESNITVKIQTASINTGWEPRDNHLKTSDWFDVDLYPVMSFTSSQITSLGDGNYVAKGILKIRNVEKNIDLPFKLLGVKKIPEEMRGAFGGNDEVASFEIANFQVNRKEFKVGTGTSTTGEAAMTYRDVVGSSVNLNIVIEVNRKSS